MSSFTRRQLLQHLAGCVASAGTVVLAQTVLANGNEPATATPANPEERADRLAEELPAPESTARSFFRNTAFRNGGGFRNGGFHNAGFRNGGFANGGGFRNGGGFVNGGFRNW